MHAQGSACLSLAAWCSTGNVLIAALFDYGSIVASPQNLVPLSLPELVSIVQPCSFLFKSIQTGFLLFVRLRPAERGINLLLSMQVRRKEEQLQGKNSDAAAPAAAESETPTATGEWVGNVRDGVGGSNGAGELCPLPFFPATSARHCHAAAESYTHTNLRNPNTLPCHRATRLQTYGASVQTDCRAVAAADLRETSFPARESAFAAEKAPPVRESTFAAEKLPPSGGSKPPATKEPQQKINRVVMSML